jgi:2-polyprenyl-6-methoxyphenol hydroxylase-like FAD-dependent oxidoreductase
VLEQYQRRHMRATRPMYHGTNEIVKFFTDDRPPVKLARKLVLRFSNNFPPIRRAIRAKLTEAGNGFSRRRQSRPS